MGPFCSFFTLTDRPATALWLTQEEKDLAIARVKSERVGATEVLDGLDKTKLVRGILNPITLSTACIFLLNNVTVQGLAFFAPTIVKTIYPTESTIRQQLYTVPPYVVGGFFVLLFSWLSWRLDRRQIFIALANPLVMIGYIMFLATNVARVRYGATFLIASSAFAVGSISNAQVSANVLSDTARSSAIGTNGKTAFLTLLLSRDERVLTPSPSHVWQYWRLDFYLEFPTFRRTGLSHRKRPQSCYCEHGVDHSDAHSGLDEPR